MNILIIDDSRTMRDMISFTLEGTGKFKCFQADDGAKAIEFIKTNTVDISLIITDLNMPNMDGISFITTTRTMPLFKYTPILMLTTESDDEKKMLGKQAGATGWLVKPFQPEKLVATVYKVCGIES